MEAIGELIMQKKSNQEKSSSMTFSQDLREHESTPEEGKPFEIRSDKAIAEGYSWENDPPEPVKCDYCGKSLYHDGILRPFQQNQVFKWLQEPERCDCERAKEYWDKYEAKQKEAEEEKENQERAERMQHKINMLFKNSGMKLRVMNNKFESFKVDKYNNKAYEIAKKYVETFQTMIPKMREDGSGIVQPPDNKCNGLFITGSCGTGKTHLAAAIANQLLATGTPVIFMTMIDLLTKIRETYNRNNSNSESDITKTYGEVTLLIIDDIGSEQPTEWASTMIFAIINARYEGFMPTIVTTNYDGEELARRMTPIVQNGMQIDNRNAEKTLDRLKETCVGIDMRWESWRSK